MEAPSVSGAPSNKTTNTPQQPRSSLGTQLQQFPRSSMPQRALRSERVARLRGQHHRTLLNSLFRSSLRIHLKRASSPPPPALPPLLREHIRVRQCHHIAWPGLSHMCVRSPLSLPPAHPSPPPPFTAIPPTSLAAPMRPPPSRSPASLRRLAGPPAPDPPSLPPPRAARESHISPN